MYLGIATLMFIAFAIILFLYLTAEGTDKRMNVLLASSTTFIVIAIGAIFLLVFDV